MTRSEVHSRNDSPAFAAIVPVGATAVGLWRGIQLIQSLLFWEPALACCVVLDDSPTPRGIAELASFPSSCRVVTLQRPLEAGLSNRTWVGGLSAGILSALSWIQANTTVAFALRIDTDALVIAPFSRVLALLLVGSPNVGVCGTIGVSCNPLGRRRQNPNWQPRILRAMRLWPLADAPIRAETLHVDTFGEVTKRQRRCFDAIRPHVFAAVCGGYATHEYCQGGACAITREMLDRMARARYLETSHLWMNLPFPDDGVLAMYARAVGLDLADYSQPGEPFGLQHIGLPYPPEELLARHHSLIHSVKNDPTYSEHYIRSFFAHAASTARH